MRTENLEVDKNLLLELDERFNTPFYLFDQSRFENNLTRFKAELERQYPNIVIGYSFKTNYLPSICKSVKNIGCHAEVVSEVELDLAIRLGFGSDIIYNGPIKSVSSLIRAIDIGATINLDNIEQVKDLVKLEPLVLKHLKCGLRMNIDLATTIGAGKIAKGGLFPRFGLNPKEIDQVVRTLREHNIEIIALHGHCSSSDRSPENYSIISSYLLEIAKKYSLDNLKILDVGGGFMGEMPVSWNQAQQQITYAQYAEAICSPLVVDKWFNSKNISIVIEPGMSVIADTFTLVTKILSKKQHEERLIFGVDANFYHVRPTYHSRPLDFGHVSKENNIQNRTSVNAIVGATCMERDVLLQNIVLDNPLIGDLIVIGNVGAYCSVLTPHFINYTPAIVTRRKDNSFELSRRHQTFEDFFIGYKM